MNVIRTTTDLAKLISDQYIHSESIVVDATVGNGNDTLYYCQKCAFVYGFDIQNTALDNARRLLNTNKVENYQLICDSHANMDQYINQKIDLVLFNLGYLPNGDKSITTTTDSTITAINKAINLLKVNGLVCIVIYYGHDNGKEEREAILQLSENLDSKLYHVGYFSSPNQKRCPPEIIFITKKK